MEGTFGLVARVDDKEVEVNPKTGEADSWYWVEPFCECMLNPQVDESEHNAGKVNWLKSEMIPLSDEEALCLMAEHDCITEKAG